MKKIFASILGALAFMMSPLSAQGCCCDEPPVQKTLSIVKPDAVKANHIGEISARFEKEGLKVIAAKMVHLNKEQAEAFYAVHKERPFYSSLVNFMCSGPIFVQVLEGKDAIAKNREIMGATNPALAKEGTLRSLFASSVEQNAVHGSDSKDSAKQEISFFFKDEEIFSR